MSNSDTRIPMSYETRDELKELGSKGETYDSIVQRLLSVYHNHVGERSE